MTERQIDTVLRTLFECQSLVKDNLRLYNGILRAKVILAKEKRRRRNFKKQA